MRNFHWNRFSVLVLLCAWKTADTLICYSCADLPHPSDCGNIEQCGEHEFCHVENTLLQDGTSTFTSNCLDSDRCSAGSMPVVGKRQDRITKCSRCCNSSYCNMNLCDSYTPSTSGVRCLSCNDVLDPSDCKKIVECSRDDMCYTQVFRVNDEVRYRLGCAPKSYCQANINTTLSPPTTVPVIPQVPVGRRQTSLTDLFGTPCAMGCQTENCNRELCTSSSSSGCQLAQLPYTDTCEDISTYGCILIVTVAAKQQEKACDIAEIRTLFCPDTCGLCKNNVITQAPSVNSTMVTNANTIIATTDTYTSSMVTPTTKNSIPSAPPTTSVLPGTTAHGYTPYSCGDPFPEFICHKVDCEINLCSDNELKSLCPNYCAGKCRLRDCGDIPGYNSQLK